MRLDEYIWSRNPRGLHVASAFQSPPDYWKYENPQFGWVKLVCAGTEYVDDSVYFLSRGITPIARLYVERYGAGPFDQHLQSIVRAFASVGVKWFEFYNEPNVDVEWPIGFDPSWEDTNTIIRPMMDNWLNFAEYVVSLGCYPGFVSLTESNVPRYATVPWMDQFLNYLANNHYDRFNYVLQNGLYCATHPYVANHFYQEIPGRGPLSARPSRDQRSQEPGWHWEYPYDPICQADDPGRTVYGGTALSPYGDPNGLIAVGRMFNERCNMIWGSENIPVVGTEGGVLPIYGGPHQQDDRYPSYDEHSHAEATVAMFEWIAREAPPWFFGLCLWKEDILYPPEGGYAPAIDHLQRIPPVLKQVPPFEVMGDPRSRITPTPTISGPGPIRGTADHHMILLAPGLDAGWFFDTAQAYWNHFRPIVSSRSDLIHFIPNTQSLAITLISPPAMVDTIVANIRLQYPNIYIDQIAIESQDEIREILNTRVRENKRFG